MALIKLHGYQGKGYFAIVDDDLVDKANQHKWYLTWVGYNYCRVQTNNGERLHHLVAGKPPSGSVTDHKNGNTLDNRRENLHFVSQAENTTRASLRRNKGYYFDQSRNKWAVSIGINGKSVNGGRFTTEAEAKARADTLRGAKF